ncbi:MAG TPA: winged helix-turn-helix domain-containing protein [Caulobacteraceae bacterium]
MIYRFGSFSFDTEKCELRSGGAAVPIEPQVFSLLQLLIENRERLLSRDEIVERVWNGRIVSDAAISSRIKSARRALGDDGEAQRYIRTVPKRGFRFVGEVEGPVAPTVAEARPAEAPASRPSIAVLPFAAVGEQARAMADALPHDLITELSCLRWLFVIARGSSFRFRGAEADAATVREALKVRYCLTGSVEMDERSMTLIVELCDTADGGVVWSERYRARAEAVHELREEIVQSIVSALELQIPHHEVRQARLKAPDQLDAWAAYHLGLHQMYRFDRQGNTQAAAMFERAIALEPTFARAHAALSFTHFENAFLRFADDAARARDDARRCAETGLEHDPLDPFCNLVMGRVSWLSGDLDASLPWLERSIRLNPSFAQAKYSLAWAETLMGAGARGQANTDEAMQLSPLDPMTYAMRGVRAFTHVVLDEPSQAAEWAELAARTPGAHALIEMIAAISHTLNGDDERARRWAGSALARQPGLNSADFFAAFPFREDAARARVSQALARLGV